MFTRIAACAIAVILACNSASADALMRPSFQMPSAFETLVTAGQSYDGSFTVDQFVAYSLTFGMTLSQSWDGTLPADFNDRAFGLLSALVLGGTDINNAAIAGSNDATLFVSAYSPDSGQTQAVVSVLLALIDA